MKTGWWKLTYAGVEDLNECDKEHVADLIQQGFTEGEIIQEVETAEIGKPR